MKSSKDCPIISYMFILVCFFSVLTTELFSSDVKTYNSYQNFEHNFVEDIYDSYFEQIAAKVRNMKNLPSELKECFFFPGKNPIEKKLNHQKIIQYLRNIISSKYYVEEQANDIYALSSLLYTHSNLSENYEKFLGKYISLNNEEIEKKPLSQQVHEIYENLRLDLTDKGHPSPKQDLHLEGFLSSAIYTDDLTTQLYMANVVLDNGINKQIDPIFLGHLAHLKKEGKKHLYINVKEVDEALVELAQTEEFKDSFVFISLDRESHFYFQKDIFDGDLVGTEFFKDDLKRNVLENNHSFYWPKIFLENDWNYKLDQIINETDKLFQFKRFLTKKEAGAFIEIVNAKLIELSIGITQASFVNATCAYTMDRGPSQFAFFYIYNIWKKRNELTIEEKHKFLTLFFVSPIIVQNRTSHDYRVNRMVEALQFLNL